MEASVEQKHQYIWVFVWYHWAFQRVCTSSGNVDSSGFSASELLLEMRCEEDTFSFRYCITDVSEAKFLKIPINYTEYWLLPQKD